MGIIDAEDDMRTEPLVSVIMPIFNAEKYLFEAIKSILQQTYSNLELILVDDASEIGRASCRERV